MIKVFENFNINIRPYEEPDMNQLEQLDTFIALQIKYHGGVKSENVFCAIENDNIIGAGLLTLFQDEKAEFYTFADAPAITEMLTECLIKRFVQLKKENSKLVLRTCRRSDEIAEIQFLLNRGFNATNTIFWLKYDLSGNITHYSIPGEVEIKTYEFDGESMPKYLKAAEESGLIPIKDPADSWFRMGAPGFTCFTALYNDNVIGSVTIFDTSEECSATEFIFVSPRYRRKNIAKELIATALSELKKRSRKEASLSVFGTNLPAINLYLSMGYYLTGSIIELKRLL